MDSQFWREVGPGYEERLAERMIMRKAAVVEGGHEERVGSGRGDSQKNFVSGKWAGGVWRGKLIRPLHEASHVWALSVQRGQPGRFSIGRGSFYI